MGSGSMCVRCGRTLIRARQTDMDYTQGELSGITLVNVSVLRCRCGHEEVSIPKKESLHRVLARELARKEAALTGPEIRLLRAHLAVGRRELALLLAVPAAKLVRWEFGGEEMNRCAELALRYLVLACTGGHVAELMQRMAAPGQGLLPAAPAQLRLIFDNGIWYADRRATPSERGA